MSRQATSRIARLVWSRTDLPRPLGLEVRSARDLTVYLADDAGYEVWKTALIRVGNEATAMGFRYCAGVLTPRGGGDLQVTTVIMTRVHQEGK